MCTIEIIALVLASFSLLLSFFLLIIEIRRWYFEYNGHPIAEITYKDIFSKPNQKIITAKINNNSRKSLLILSALVIIQKIDPSDNSAYYSNVDIKKNAHILKILELKSKHQFFHPKTKEEDILKDVNEQYKEFCKNVQNIKSEEIKEYSNGEISQFLTKNNICHYFALIDFTENNSDIPFQDCTSVDSLIQLNEGFYRVIFIYSSILKKEYSSYSQELILSVQET